MSDEHDEVDEGADAPKTVPYERFQRVASERRALREQVAGMEALKTQAAELPKLHAERARLEAQLGLARAGIMDEDGAEVAMLLHSKLPEDKRPPIGDWVKSLRDAPDTIPKPLAGYLSPPAAPAQPAAPAARPPSSAGAASSGAPVVSKASLDEAHKRAMSTRSPEDLATYRKLQAEFLKGNG
jgi:hypothetical protein